MIIYKLNYVNGYYQQKTLGYFFQRKSALAYQADHMRDNGDSPGNYEIEEIEVHQ